MKERIEKPWGYEIIWAKTDSYVGKLLHINSGHRLSKQYHKTKEETIYVLRGTLHNFDENDVLTRHIPGESLHISDYINIILIARCIFDGSSVGGGICHCTIAWTVPTHRM